MELHEAIRRRRTVHRYGGGTVDPAVIKRALEAAQWAPSHYKVWPWRFTQLGPMSKAAFADLAASLLRDRETPASEQSIRVFQRLVLNSAELILVSCLRSDKPNVNRDNLAAVAACIQNILLSLTADGIDSKWGNKSVIAEPEAYEFLGIDEDLEEIVAYVAVGYAELDRPISIPERPALGEVLRQLR